MHRAYSDWLRRAVPSEATWRTKLSELRRVEAVYGDVDELYDQDELQSLIDDLTYTSEDGRTGRENPSKLEIVGDLRNNLASYKSAVQKYVRFRQDVELDSVRPALGMGGDDDLSAPREPQASTFSFERDLQSALRENMEQLEQGLEAIDGGVERTVPSGRIDILAKDASRNLVVIELKAVTAQAAVFGQISAYMGDLIAEHGEQVRGIVVAPDFHPRLVSAARTNRSLKLIKYGFSFTFEDAEG